MAWVAVVLVTGVVSAAVHADDEPSARAAPTTASTAITVPVDLSQALVDLSASGYSEFPTALSGVLDLEKILSAVPA